MSSPNSSRFLPLYVALGVVAGMLLGSFYANLHTGKHLSIVNASGNKINDLLHIIDDQYVDTVDIPQIVEDALPGILRELDPHSVYIPKDEVASSMQELNGAFSGIGVQFILVDDTVCIERIIEGGPSGQVGLRAGDRLLTADGHSLCGPDITNEQVMKRLKGETGTKVRLTLHRPGVKQPLTFTVVRGAVPVKSVDAVCMVSPTVGYMRVNTFGENTYSEFLGALATLGESGMRHLVLDLRGNLGGYMNAAVQMAGEFLPGDRLIVYTEGRKSPREDFRSDGTGADQTLPLAVLVDETSASSSEIFAGAIQDNDRGLLIGRRTFGKGLVQVPIELSDGSMLRITKARYYTPSGRCVQKPYTPGSGEDYETDLLRRADHGEYFSADSIKTHGRAYRTRLGRTVYGGGGIIPDIFIPRDTSGITPYYKDAYVGGYLQRFGFVLMDRYRTELSALATYERIVSLLSGKNVCEAFAQWAEARGLRRRPLMIHTSRHLIEQCLYADVIGCMLGQGASARYLGLEDPALLRGIKELEGGRGKPAVPTRGGARGRTSLLVRPAGGRCLALDSWLCAGAGNPCGFASFPRLQALYSQSLLPCRAR